MAREPFNRIWTETPEAPEQFDVPTESMWTGGWKGGIAQEPPEAYAQNWWQNRVDFALQQIERYGVMNYESEAIYGIGGRARGSDGKFYLSVTAPNQGNDPTTDGGLNWVIDSGPGNSIAVFSSPGTTAWQVPAILSTGVRVAHVTVIGGGGGGNQGGGSGSGVAMSIVNLSGVSSVNVTVGAGGAPSPGGPNQGGVSGGNSSFGAYVSCPGGVGSGTGTGRTQSIPPTTGLINIAGGTGGGINFAQGGWNMFSGPGIPPVTDQQSATGAVGYGGGGGGDGGISGASPSRGSDGVVIIRW